MRPEASLAYAIITFVHTVIDLPNRIDRFVENQDRNVLTSRTLTPHKLKNIKSISSELIDVFRAIYLWDANYLDKKMPRLRNQSATGQKRLTEAQVRQAMIELQSERLRDGHESNSGISMSENLAKDMYSDAIHTLKAEKVLPDQRQPKAQATTPSVPDPQLSPALAWRFACTRADVPLPNLDRPYVPQI